MALGLAACNRTPEPAVDAKPPVAAKPAETADQFIARVNKEYAETYAESTSAEWLSQTYIGFDSEKVSSASSARGLTQLNGWIEQAAKFKGTPMTPETARAIDLLKQMTSMPAPRDPAKLDKLTQIAARLSSAYGAGTYCTDPKDSSTCRQLGALSDVLSNSRDYDAQLDAWQGWHRVAQPMKADYIEFVSLVNEGSRGMGFKDAGEQWRSGYDMGPVEFAAETDRLWNQVKPLYEQLHCYARGKLEEEYGADKGQVNGMLPAHLTGNMWQQDWGNLWDLLQPYPGVSGIDITAPLKDKYGAAVTLNLRKNGATANDLSRVEADRAAQLQVAKEMTERAQDFYTSLGMQKLPDSYWQRTQFIKPLDRDVVCHASAWDMDLKDDVRTKMCIKPNEEDFTTIYHELGHVYYYLAYHPQPPIFQRGANDGFHEAIGDTIVLSMTPKYLASIGMADGAVPTGDRAEKALVNAQMRMALAKVAFLPFGLMIDRWRWRVFDGSIQPEQYNAAWWKLKAQYQGVAPVTPRGEEFFDAGAKYHVPANTPYTRYFLAALLQFQFYKGLCDASGYHGPLNECSFYNSKEAGAKFQAMLAKGASQPWQQTLKEATGSDHADASAMLEYFGPLDAWLRKENAGKSCGWEGEIGGPAVPGAPASPAAPAAAPAPGTIRTITH